MNDLLGYAPTWAAVAMALDIVTGFYQAWCNYSIQSRAMKTGLKRKGAEALLIVIVVLVNVALNHCHAFQIPAEYADLIRMISVDGVSSYIILKEMTSVAENLGKANPELASLPFMKRIQSNHDITSGIDELAELYELIQDKSAKHMEDTRDDA